MTAQDVLLVQTSFRQIAPIAEPVTALFYARLFELDPSLRARFHGGMREEGRKLMNVLGTVITGLDQIDAILPTLHELGIRHARCGLHEKHYVTIGAAWVWTLEKGLGDVFTREVRHAWTHAYTCLTGIMIESGRSEMLAKLPVPNRLLRHITPGLALLGLGFSTLIFSSAVSSAL